jgi:hypothetical protein
VVAETDQPPTIVYLDSALDGQVMESAVKALTKMKEAAQRWKEQFTP